MVENEISLVAHSGTERAQELDIQPIQDLENTAQMIQNEETEKKTELEPHILLLKAFLGQQFAERFLDPSYEIPISPVQPLNLQTEGCGAKDYWRLLREHSEARLIQDIADVPGAFMVKRSSLSHLTTSKHLDQIKDYRRKLWLMSRASEMNEAKTILFMTNNPLPDVNEWQNTSSPLKYLHKDTFLIKKINQLEKSFYLPPLKTTNSICTPNKHINNVQTMVVGNNYRLLSEETFHGFKGEFSKRCSDKNLQSQRPYKHLTFIQQSSMHADEDESSCSATNGNRGGRPAWEPLTYTALIDFKPSVTVPGRGHFRHGQARLWLVNSSATNSAKQIKL